MNKMLLENKIKNSNLKVSKNFLYYIIAPIAILLIGIILLCTVGFNGGSDFAGYSSFTMYVNNEGTYQNAAVYDLSKADEYNAVYDKIEGILAEENLKVENIQITKIDINENETLIVGGQAVKVTFLNIDEKAEDIKVKNAALENRILAEFGYSTTPEAMTSIDYKAPAFSFNWMSGLLAAVVFGILAALIYFSIRNRSFAILVMGIIQVALDVLVSLGLILICRVPVNMTISIIVAITAILSVANVFLFVTKSKENIAGGFYEGLKNSEKADKTVKELAFKKALAYIGFILISILFIALATNAVRFVSLASLLAIIVSFYNANFVLPALWAATYKPSKTKKKA